MPRTLLSDGFNSFAHVALGMTAALFPTYTYYIIAGFTVYQVSEFKRENDHLFVDLSEFILGFVTIKLY